MYEFVIMNIMSFTLATVKLDSMSKGETVGLPKQINFRENKKYENLLRCYLCINYGSVYFVNIL